MLIRRTSQAMQKPVFISRPPVRPKRSGGSMKQHPFPTACPMWQVIPSNGLIVEINRFLEHFGMPPTRFGVYFHDKQLVADIVRRGRNPRSEMEARIWAFMAKMEG